MRQHLPIPGGRTETKFRARGFYLWWNQSLSVSAHAVSFKEEFYSVPSTLENPHRHTQQTSVCTHRGQEVAGRKVISGFTQPWVPCAIILIVWQHGYTSAIVALLLRGYPTTLQLSWRPTLREEIHAQHCKPGELMALERKLPLIFC